MVNDTQTRPDLPQTDLARHRRAWTDAHERLTELLSGRGLTPRREDLDPEVDAEFRGETKESAAELVEEAQRLYDAYLQAVRTEVGLGV